VNTSGLIFSSFRVCGENRAEIQDVTASMESPPRVRGILQFDFNIHKKARITPAHAGKTA